MTQSVCHVGFMRLGNPSRIEKEIQFLRENEFTGEVSVFGVHDPMVAISKSLQDRADVLAISPEAPLRALPVVGKLLRFFKWGWQIRRVLRHRADTIVVIHGLAALVVCCCLFRPKGRLIYDAHEYETERNGFKPWQKWLARFAEKVCIRNVSEAWAVSPSIVQAYRTRYPRTPIRLIMNLPQRPKADAVTADIRASLDIPPDRTVCGYLGALGPGRLIERYLDVFAQLWDEKTSNRNETPDLVILGEGSLRRLCEDAAARYPNIHYLPPVPPDHVVAAAGHFDIGLCLIDPSSLSYKFSLPNKFFQHLSAGNLVIVLDASTDMISFKADDNRILTTKADQLAQSITTATEAVASNANARFATEKSYFWEDQASILHEAFDELALRTE